MSDDGGFFMLSHVSFWPFLVIVYTVELFLEQCVVCDCCMRSLIQWPVPKNKEIVPKENFCGMLKRIIGRYGMPKFRGENFRRLL